MSGVNLTLPQDGHAVGTDQRSFTSTNVLSPLLTVIPRVGSKSNHVNTLTCLGWCTAHLATLKEVIKNQRHLLREREREIMARYKASDIYTHTYIYIYIGNKEITLKAEEKQAS